MKHLPRKLLSLAMALMTLSAPVMSPQLSSFTGSITANAAAAEYDQDTKTISDTDKTITYKKRSGCTWEEGAVASSVTLKSGKYTVEIPSSITLQKADKTKVTVPVTDIADNFAKALKTMKTLKIPESIKTIGKYVAYDCISLENVSFKTKQVEYLDSTFLDGPNGSKYYYDRYFENHDKNGGHVCVGEWLLKYNSGNTASSVVVKDLLKNSPDNKQTIKKIASRAFVNCSPKLETVDLSGIKCINSEGLGAQNDKYPSFSQTRPTVRPNKIKTLLNANDVESMEASSIYGTLYYMNEYYAHNNQAAYYPMVLGHVLYQILPGSATGTLDLSKYQNSYTKMDAVYYIGCSLRSDKFNSYILPRNFKNFTSESFALSLNKIKSLKYYNDPSGTSPVELKTTIINSANSGKQMGSKDKEFFKNTFMQMTGGNHTDKSLAATEGYLYDMMTALAKIFLEKKCLVNPGVKPTDAWAQYNVIRKVACGIRDNFEYRLYERNGSGNAATGFVRCMTGFTTDRKGFVCRDYADLFEFLMRTMGITAYKVTSGGHEWNTVRIYDTKDKKAHWFNIDTTGTWNTATTTFMSTDADIQYDNSSHVRKTSLSYGTQGVTVPKCTEGRGDVTRNGIVDDADVNKVMNAYAKELSGYASPLTAYEKVLADVDCNGLVDSADAQLLLQYYSETVCSSFSANPKASDYKSLEKYLYDYYHKVNEKLNEADKHKFPSWNDAEKAKLK